MKTLKNYTDEEIRYGIIRCEARLAGILSYGLLQNERKTREALREYKEEEQRRSQHKLDFE